MDLLSGLLEKYELKMNALAQPIRVALTGGTVSPPIDRVLILLGRERIRERLEVALKRVM